MSLAELFYRSNPRPSLWSGWRRRKPRADWASRLSSHASRFILEALEPRLLMAAGLPGVTELLAQTGDPAPASGGQSGGSFTGFGNPVLNEAGQAAFGANMFGSTSTNGLFRSSGPGQVIALVREDESAPASRGQLGGTFTVFFSPVLNDLGQTAFQGAMTGSTSDRGIFRSGGPGLVTLLARAGDAAPDSGGGGTSGGTFAATFFPPVLNDVGQTAFLAEVITGGSSLGIFQSSSTGLVTALVRAGDDAPAIGGQTGGRFSGNLGFPDPVLNDAGQVAFRADVIFSTAGIFEGIFRSNGPGQVAALAWEFDPAPASGGQSGGSFTGFGNPVLNDAGQAAFTANVGISGSGIFRSSGPELVTALVRTGEAAPDSGGQFGGTLSDFGNPVLNDAGQAAFNANVIFTSRISEAGIFRSSGPGLVTTLALAGNAAPDGNGTLVSFGAPILTEGGTVLFLANLSGTAGGTTDDTGLFLADSQEIVQLAREGQSVFGSTINGLTLSTDALTDGGQVAFNASLANGKNAIGLFTPDLHWRLTKSDAWGTSSNWTVSLTPSTIHDIFIDPLTGVTVTGPAQATMVDLLTIGATATGQATLRLDGGGNLSVTNGITIQSRGELDQQLGTVTAGPVTNAGSLKQASGSGMNLTALLNTGSALFNGQATVVTLENQGSLSIGSGGTLTSSDTAINFSTIENTGGVTRFLGGLTNNGAFISDRGGNLFTDLIVTDTGYLQGGLGDRFFMSGDFLSTSTQAGNWHTSAAELLIDQDVAAVHDFSIVGADHAGAVGGFFDNFSWDTVRLSAGQSLRLQDGNATAGGALYVKNLVLEGGLSQINSITGNGLNIYYDSLASANGYLGEQTYGLQNGGLLAPMRSLDFDANGLADALTDGILAVRHLFGFTGDPLTSGVVDPAGLRTSASALGNYLSQAQDSLLDVDGNGTADALSDGIVIVRYLFGFTGDALITGVVDPAGSRNSAAAIEAFLKGFLPPPLLPTTSAAPAPTSSTVTSSVVMSAQTTATPSTDLSLAYVQRSWVKGFVAGDMNVADASDEEELLIALPA